MCLVDSLLDYAHSLTPEIPCVTNSALLPPPERESSRSDSAPPPRWGVSIQDFHDLTVVCPDNYTTAPSSRPDGSWESENVMVQAAVGHIRASAVDGCLVLQQFRTSFGLPDILELQYDEDRLRSRMQSVAEERSGITKDSARLVHLVSSRGVVTEQIASRELGFSFKRLTSAITALIERGLVLDCEGDLLFSEREEGFFLTSIIVYEAKLKDWAKGLAQAQRHLWFAQESLVLLPQFSERVGSRLIPACETAGVGIATVDDKELKKVASQKMSPAPRNWLTWYLNEIVLDVKAREPNAF